MKLRDLTAGLSLAGLMLPEAVAYAGIAGLSSGRAIAATIAGTFVYALVGQSRFGIISPTSSSAAILAAALAATAVPGGDRDAAATLLVALTAALFLIAAALRLGALASFVARPVLRGFAFGLALTIIVRQLPALTGTPDTGGNVLVQALRVAAAVAHWNWPSLWIGLVAIGALVALRRVPGLPATMIVLLLGLAASLGFGLADRGVAMVGAITFMPAVPDPARIPWSETLPQLQLALPLALILLAESWGTLRALSLRHGEPLEAGRELTALGLANLAALGVQGMPVGAGFSAGSAAEASGARTRWTAGIAAAGLLLLVLAARPLIALVPQPVIAAVVIVALLHALDPGPLARLWRLDRDQYVGTGAALGVLMLGVLDGMLFAIGLSILALVQRLALPNIAELGRVGDGHEFVDMSRHPEAQPAPGVAIYRPTETLFFANAERVFAMIDQRLAHEPAATCVVLSLEESFDIDSTALDALIEFDTDLRAEGRRLWLARLHDRVRDALTMAGAAELVSHSRFSVDSTVAAALGEE